MEAVDEGEGEFVEGADEEEGEDEVGEVGHYLWIQEWVRSVWLAGLRGCGDGGRRLTRLWISFFAALKRMKPAQ